MQVQDASDPHKIPYRNLGVYVYGERKQTAVTTVVLLYLLTQLPFPIEEEHVAGQNSLTPRGNNNFGVKRNQIVHLKQRKIWVPVGTS